MASAQLLPAKCLGGDWRRRWRSADEAGTQPGTAKQHRWDQFRGTAAGPQLAVTSDLRLTDAIHGPIELYVEDRVCWLFQRNDAGGERQIGGIGGGIMVSAPAR